MKNGTELISFMHAEKHLHASNRAIRLQLIHHNTSTNDILLPQSVIGKESVCGGFSYTVNCIATSYSLPLKEFIGLSASLEFVNDRGQLRRVVGLVSQASSGDYDGGIASYQIVIQDAITIMERRINTRVFRKSSWPQIVTTVLNEWIQNNSALAGNFYFEFACGFRIEDYPVREQTLQFNETDGAFVRRLLARSGIPWFFRVGGSKNQNANQDAKSMLAHTLVLFADQRDLEPNAAGIVRYHQDAGTQHRDSVTHWSAVRKLQAGSVSIFSWDFKRPGSHPWLSTEVPSKVDQGPTGNSFAGGLQEFIVESPHVAADDDDLYRMGMVRMQRKELEAKSFVGEGTVRDFCAGEYFTITGHEELNDHPAAEREFIITSVEIKAQNNLPKSLEERAQQLFRNSGWNCVYGDSTTNVEGHNFSRFHIRFEAVRRTIPIVPAFDPVNDLLDPGMQTAVVVGDKQDVVHCDEYGRVKIRFPATRNIDHTHANGAGASDTDSDSAWVRVATSWAGSAESSCGTLTLPRVGTEVLIAFLGRDPDKPIIIAQLFNARAFPPQLSESANLPSTRFLSGMRSQEIHGGRANRLRFDDTPDQISAQLASDDGASELNLGWLTHPRGESGRPRGEGAELRSDKAVAIRGGKGVLISAHSSPRVNGKQLDRAELISLADGLHDIASQLSKLAEAHARDSANGGQLAQLVEKLKGLDEGTNIAAGGSNG